MKATQLPDIVEHVDAGSDKGCRIGDILSGDVGSGVPGSLGTYNNLVLL